MEKNRSQPLLITPEMQVGGLNLEIYMWLEMVIEPLLMLTRSLSLVVTLMTCELP